MVVNNARPGSRPVLPFHATFHIIRLKGLKEFKYISQNTSWLPLAFGVPPKFSKTRYCCSSPLILGSFNSKGTTNMALAVFPSTGNCLPHASSRFRRFITVRANGSLSFRVRQEAGGRQKNFLPFK